MKPYRLALDTGEELIQIGDTVKALIHGERIPTTAKLIGIFRSVHAPQGIHINLSDRPYHKSIDVDDIAYIHKTEEVERDG